MPDLPTGELEQRRDAVLSTLRQLRARGVLSAAKVRAGAEAAEVSTRTIYRWLAQGERQPTGHRRAWRVPTRGWELYVQWRGNVSAVHRELSAEGVEVPTLRGLQMAFKREATDWERAYIREGESAIRDRAVYLRHEASFRGECYEGDHKLLSIEVLVGRSHHPYRPWATLFIDQFSRLIVGWAITLQPNADAVLAAIRKAVTDEPGRRFGGVPMQLRWDNGREFDADAVKQAAAVMGCLSVCCQPYSPWQKGKIERLNRTLEDELLRGLPRWSHGPRDARGHLIDKTPPLTLELFSALFADYVEHYNQARPHRGIDDRTPLAVWQSDSTPVRRLSVAEARWMVRARATKTVGGYGINHRKRFYWAPELNGLAGQSVEIAFMPNDLRSVDVYREGKFLTTAMDQNELTNAQKQAYLQRRNADAAAIRKRAAKARRAARMRVAPITVPGVVEELTSPSALPARQDTAKVGVLRLLGRENRLNQPRIEDRDA